MKEVFLKNKKDNLKVLFKKNKRSKRINIKVYLDGSVSLICPTYVSEERAFSFLNGNLDWIEKKIKTSKENIDQDIAVFDQKHYKKYKEKARILVEDKVRYWNSFYNFSFSRISIRNQKSRWGSCSSKGNLSFNYKILFLDEDLQDYLTVHEICHLKHMNHSKDFWNTVALTIPDYKRKTYLLKRAGSLRG